MQKKTADEGAVERGMAPPEEEPDEVGASNEESSGETRGGRHGTPNPKDGDDGEDDHRPRQAKRPFPLSRCERVC